jgi:hypothetical protein
LLGDLECFSTTLFRILPTTLLAHQENFTTKALELFDGIGLATVVMNIDSKH